LWEPHGLQERVIVDIRTGVELSDRADQVVLPQPLFDRGIGRVVAGQHQLVEALGARTASAPGVYWLAFVADAEADP